MGRRGEVSPIGVAVAAAGALAVLSFVLGGRKGSAPDAAQGIAPQVGAAPPPMAFGRYVSSTASASWNGPEGALRSYPSYSYRSYA